MKNLLKIASALHIGVAASTYHHGHPERATCALLVAIWLQLWAIDTPREK